MLVNKRRSPRTRVSRSISLRELAGHLGLSATTVSLVLNASPAAQSIPAKTQERVFAAARKLNYRPNFFARSLRSQRSFLIGVMVPEVGESYGAMIISGIEQYLMPQGYIYLVSSHGHKPELLDRLPRLLYERCVEGVIAVDSASHAELPVPMVCVSGHERLPGVSNIVLNHEIAADLGLRHLADFEHRRIAVFQGQTFSSDTTVRWQAISDAAVRLGVPISPSLVVQLEGERATPEPGYRATQKLLATGEPFTALWAFNDLSAIGAIRALRDAGKRVPQDVSVLGFDDIDAAAFHNPSLTTVRQPLDRMGMLAAETLLTRIANPSPEDDAKDVEVCPELIVRESTGPALGGIRR